ncbi:MAG: hypothetical protein ACLFVU_07285 [Phycisphaerae bacterium]
MTSIDSARREIRRRVRVAQALRDRLRQCAAEADEERRKSLSLLVQRVEHMRRDLSRWDTAAHRSWGEATRRMEGRAERMLPEIGYLLDAARQGFSQRQVRVPDLRTVLAELAQLEAEFGGVEVGGGEPAIAVITEPIVLEGIALGAFRLTLDVGSLRLDRPDLSVRAEALEPNPAAINDAYTHPHICDQRICLGEATLPVRQALATGRLADLFCILRSTLTTYNPSSPYVAIEDWHGCPCAECGYVTAEEDRISCTSCEDAFCSECVSWCAACDEATCLSCLQRCEPCEDLVCRGCLTTCPVCGKSVCSTCLRECEECGRSLCRDCEDEDACPHHPDRKDPDHEETPNEWTPSLAATTAGRGACAADVAFQPARVGEVAVPAGPQRV